MPVELAGGPQVSGDYLVGAAFLETKFGHVEAVDVRGDTWSFEPAPSVARSALKTETRPGTATGSEEVARIAVLVSMTPHPDLSAFSRLADQDGEDFALVSVIAAGGGRQIEPDRAAVLSTEIAAELKGLAATRGRAEVHLAFHGPYPMAVLIGRHLNTLRVVAYEWQQVASGRTVYAPTLVLQSGSSRGPVTETPL